MGALDDLIAQASGGSGGASALDDLVARASQPDPADERGRSTTGGEVDPSIPPQPMPEEDHWYTNLLAPVAGALPGGALSHAANNPGLNAAAQGFAHGATAGLDQNIPVYGDYVRQERAQALHDMPAPFHAGDFAGSVANPANLTGSLARNVGGAAIQGAARTYSDADPNTPIGQRALLAAGGGAVAAGASLVGAGVARGAGWLGSKVAQGAQAVADRARNIGWGMPATALEEFGAQRGLAPNAALRTFVSEGEQIAPPNAILPKGPGSYQPQFAAGQQRAGQQVGQSMADAQAEGIAQMDPNARGTLLRRLDAEGDKAMYSGVDREPYANALARQGQAVQRGPAFNTPQDLRAAKTRFGESAYGSSPDVGEAASKQAADFARGTVRDQLNDYMGQASPQIGQAFNQANQRYGVAATLNDATTSRASAINTGAGGGIGGQGFVGRMMNMVPGGSLIPDAAANAGRGIQNAAGGFGATARGAADLAGPAANSGISGWLQSKGVSLENVPQQSRGNQLGDAAQRLLQTEPQALGQYQQQFQQAAQQGSTAINQLIIKLERDPDFRTGPMLRLQHMTGEN
jgi:hypothetical protein